MHHKIILFVFHFQCLVILISFFSSFLLLNEIRVKKMRWFILHNTIAVIVMIPMFLFANQYYNFPFATQLNNLSLIFEFSFLSIFILYHIDIKRLWGVLLFFVFLSATILSLVIYRQSNLNYTAFSVNHFGLFIFCTIFLIRFFKNGSKSKIIECPEFFVVIGVFILSVMSLPTLIIADFVGNDYIKISTFLCTLPNISFAIFHIFLIISFLCSYRIK